MGTPIEIDLERLERELGNEEGVLEGELGSLKAMAAELEARARKAQQLADELAVIGAAEVSSRLKRLVVPQVNDSAFERARQARAEAIKVRREATAQVRQTLDVTRRLLRELSGQLESSEHEARETLSRIAEKARVAAEEVRQHEHLEPQPQPEPHAGATAIGTHLSIDQAIAATVIAARPSQRREQQRVKVQTAVDLHTDSNFYMAFSANISEGGIFVGTVLVRPIGTEIDVDFTLPSGDRIQARGVVRWVREVSDRDPDTYPGMGIQFTEIDTDAQDKIRRFIDGRDPIFYVD